MLHAFWQRVRAPTLASLLARRPPAAAIEAFGQPYRQHVRIRTRRRLRNAVLGTAVVYGCWATLMSQVAMRPREADDMTVAESIGSITERAQATRRPRAEHDDKKHKENADDEDGDDDDDDDEPLLVLPLPFTFQLVESRPYKGSDPEWQAYVRISKDKTLMKRIRGDLTGIVRAAAENNAILARRCGTGFKVRASWLSYDFPYRPPPRILRDALEITPSGIYYVTEEVDSTTMLRVTRALWPEAVALSASSFVTTLARQNLQGLARLIGFDLSGGVGGVGSDSDGRRGATGMPAGVHRHGGDGSISVPRLEGPPGDGARSGDNDAGPGIPKVVPPVTTTLKRGDESSSSSVTPSHDSTMQAKDLVPFEALRSSLESAYHQFRVKLAEKWRPLRPLPPSGCVGVKGLVELQAANALVTIDASGFWNPATNQFEKQTLVMKLRDITPMRKSPLGGR